MLPSSTSFFKLPDRALLLPRFFLSYTLTMGRHSEGDALPHRQLSSRIKKSSKARLSYAMEIVALRHKPAGDKLDRWLHMSDIAFDNAREVAGVERYPIKQEYPSPPKKRAATLPLKVCRMCNQDYDVETVSECRFHNGRCSAFCCGNRL